MTMAFTLAGAAMELAAERGDTNVTEEEWALRHRLVRDLSYRSKRDSGD